MEPKLKADAQLLSRAIEGDAEAFGDLYQRYLLLIYRYMYYRLGDPHGAEDLTEMVFLSAWEALPSYKIEKSSFRTWLYRIAHNRLVDHYRTRKIEVPLSFEPQIKDYRPSPEEEVIDQEGREWISAAIAKLQPDYQQILVLRFIEGFSHTEAAQVLERSVGAVRVLQHRALRALAKELLGRNGVPND